MAVSCNMIAHHKIKQDALDMMVHAFNPSTWKAEVGGSL